MRPDRDATWLMTRAGFRISGVSVVDMAGAISNQTWLSAFWSVFHVRTACVGPVVLATILLKTGATLAIGVTRTEVVAEAVRPLLFMAVIVMVYVPGLAYAWSKVLV